MMLLWVSASRIYNTISILISSRKKKIGCCSISFLVLPGRSPGKMLLFLNACRIYNTFSIFIGSRKKKLCICFRSFLIHQSRSPGMILLCLSACRIYNTFSISIRSRKKNSWLFYVLSGSPIQKSWHDVIMPERFQDI